MTVSTPIPPDEAERIRVLRRYAILDTLPEDQFDQITALAAKLFDAPIALISLIDEDRQWFKSTHGLDACESSRDIAFCAHAILGDDVLVVLDTTKDKRFRENPFVTEDLNVRFYAGAPLRCPQGQALGTLCIIDQKARREFSADDQATLKMLAEMVMTQIEIRSATGNVLTEVENRISAEDRHALAEHQLNLFFKYTPGAVAMLDCELRYMAASDAWCESYDLDPQEILGTCYQEQSSAVSEEWQKQIEDCLAGNTLDGEEHKVTLQSGAVRWFRRSIRPWHHRDGQVGGLVLSSLDTTQQKIAARALEKQQLFNEAVLENVKDGIVACDEHGNLTMFNRASRDILNRNAEAIDPRQWAERYNLFAADGKTLLNVEDIPLFRAWRGETVTDQDIVISPEGGTQLQIVASAQPMFDADGAFLGAVATMQDVTERRKAEQNAQNAMARVRKSEEQLRLVTNHLPFVVSYVDTSHRFRFANRTACLWYATNENDIIGKHVKEVVGEGRFEYLSQFLSKAENGDETAYTAKVDYHDGVTRTIQGNCVVDRETDGSVRGYVTIAVDITELKDAEENLRRQKADLRLILDNVPARIFYKDDQDNIINLNNTAAKSVGNTVEDAKGKKASEICKAIPVENFDDDAEVLRSGLPKLAMVERYTQPNGDSGWARTDKVPHIDPETGERTLLIVSTDITTEIRTMEALATNEKRYRNLYNETPVMLHSINENGELISVSDFWLEKMGYTREEVIGRKSTDFLSPESARKAREETLPEFFKTGMSKDVEFQFVTKSGQTMDVLLSAVVERGDGGNSRRSLAVITDITERKAVEKRFIQAQKMESVGQLTGGLAHDFNNLLGVVLGNLQLLERRYADDEKAARMISAALNAVDRGAELTKRLLAFSRRQKLETETVEIKPLIESLSQMLVRTLGEHIQLNYRVPSDLPCIETDPVQLESAILNLAVNARDAMPSGGSLVIETRLVEVDGNNPQDCDDIDPGRYILISVTDTGVGIPEDKLTNVFEPFFTTKDVGKGSGLGLSMVYGFINQSGGHIKVSSEVGIGTCVRMFLPSAKCVDQDDTLDGGSSQTQLEPERRSETILVVEDQHDVREIATSLLEDLGFSVVEAVDVDSALTQLRASEQIDLVFTDVVMPGGKTGIDLGKAIRTEWPDLPVVFTTGYAEADALQEGDVRTAQNLVTKPYRQDDLAKIIGAALDRGSKASAREVA